MAAFSPPTPRASRVPTHSHESSSSISQRRGGCGRRRIICQGGCAGSGIWQYLHRPDAWHSTLVRCRCWHYRQCHAQVLRRLHLQFAQDAGDAWPCSYGAEGNGKLHDRLVRLRCGRISGSNRIHDHFLAAKQQHDPRQPRLFVDDRRVRQLYSDWLFQVSTSPEDLYNGIS